MKKIYNVYDRNRKIIHQVPIKEQAQTIAYNMAKRSGEIFCADNDMGNKTWYGKGGFICNMM